MALNLESRGADTDDIRHNTFTLYGEFVTDGERGSGLLSFIHRFDKARGSIALAGESAFTISYLLPRGPPFLLY